MISLVLYLLGLVIQNETKTICLVDLLWFRSIRCFPVSMTHAPLCHIHSYLASLACMYANRPRLDLLISAFGEKMPFFVVLTVYLT